MYDKIKERYLKCYITTEQLAKYVELQVLTQEQANEIQALKSQ